MGDVPMRGKGRFTGAPKTGEFFSKGGRWYLSVTYAVTPDAVAGQRESAAAAFDWGVTTLLTMAKSDGTMADVDNPRWLINKLEQIKALSRGVRGEETVIRNALGLAATAPIPFSQRTGKLNRLRRQISVIHLKASRQRKDFYHKLTALLVSRFASLGTKALAVATMARSPQAKPDPETPGLFLANGAAQKAGLNRSILDAAPSMLIGMLRTKTVEAASMFAEANTRPLKLTQRCHACGEIVKKALSERRHDCACGTDCERYENAAKTILRRLLEGNDWL